MLNSLNSLAAIVVALIACHAVEGAQNAADTTRGVSEVREVLLHDAWAHEVRIGTIAVESRVLVFRKTGQVSERIYDDTGSHDAKGTWALEQSNGSIVLVLTGKNLRDKGRFELTRVKGDDAIELRLVGDEHVLRYERRKGMAGSGTSSPN